MYGIYFENIRSHLTHLYESDMFQLLLTSGFMPKCTSVRCYGHAAAAGLKIHVSNMECKRARCQPNSKTFLSTIFSPCEVAFAPKEGNLERLIFLPSPKICLCVF